MEKGKQLVDFLPTSSLVALQDEIGVIDIGDTQFYLSKKWSMHELALFLLAQTGPSDICLSSFSISEEAVRAFATAKNMGYIKSLTVLFDYTTKKHKPDFVNFIHQVANDVRSCPNHSKAIIFRNGNVELAVVSSQNLTRNPRVECGAITAIREDVDKLQCCFDAFFEEATGLWNLLKNN